MDRGIRDSRYAFFKTRLALLEDLHVEPGAHRFMHVICVPSVSLQFVGRPSSHHCFVHKVSSKCPKSISSCLTVVFLWTVFLMMFGFSTRRSLSLCLLYVCVEYFLRDFGERGEDGAVGATSKILAWHAALVPVGQGH